MAENEFDDVFEAAAQAYGVDPDVLKGIAYAESRFRPDIIQGKVKSPKGAIGMMQFMPETAKEYGINPLDPIESITGAAAYLRKSLDRFGGDYSKAIASYNWGPNRKAFGQDDWVKQAPEETYNYMLNVLEYADKRKSSRPQPKAEQPAPKPEESGVLRQAADVPVGVAKGAVQGVRMIADAFGAGSDISNTIRGAEDYLGNLLSAQAKGDQKEIARIMKEAEDKGAGEQLKAAFQAFSTAPVDMLSQALGTAAPAILAALSAKVLGAGALVTTGVSALVGTGMGAGVVKGTIYEETKKALKEAGMPEDQAEARAQLAQSYGGKNLDLILGGAALGGLASSTGVEKTLIGPVSRRILAKAAAEEAAQQTAKPGAARRIVGGALAEAVPEVAQASQEQLAENIALQREGFDVPTERGVVGAGALEGLAGAGLGALTSVPGGREPAAPAPEVTPEAPVAPETEAREPEAPLILTEPKVITEEDIKAVAGGIPALNLPGVRRDILGRTREDLQALVDEDPEILENESAYARIIRALLEPAGQPDQLGVEPPVSDVGAAGLPDAAGAVEPDGSRVADTVTDVGAPAVSETAPTPAITPEVTETPSGITTPEALEAETQRPQEPIDTAPVIEEEAIPESFSEAWKGMNPEARVAMAQRAGIGARDAKKFSTRGWFSLPNTAKEKLEQTIQAAPAMERTELPPIAAMDEDLIEYQRMIEEAEKAGKKDLRGLRGSLRGVLKGKLPRSEVTDISPDKSLKGLIAPKGKKPTPLSTLVADGTLNDFLPFGLRTTAPTFDEMDAVAYIYDKLASGNFGTYEADLVMERSSRMIRDIEVAMREHLDMEETNKLLQEITDEQRRIDAEAEADALVDEEAVTPEAQEVSGEPEARAEEALSVEEEAIRKREEIIRRTEELNERQRKAQEEQKRLDEEALKLAAQTEESIAEAERRAAEGPAEAEREQIRRESEAGAGQFRLEQEEGRQAISGDLFAAPEVQITPEAQKEVDLSIFAARLTNTVRPFRAIYASGRKVILRPKALTDSQIQLLRTIASDAIDLGMPASVLNIVQQAGSTGMDATAAIGTSDGTLLLGKDWAKITQAEKMQALVHELGHGVDKEADGTTVKFSDKPEWKKAHDDLLKWYDSNPTKHPLTYPFAPQYRGKVNLTAESFAQAFSFYFTSPVDLQTNAPEAYAQIQSIVEGIQNESQATRRAGTPAAGTAAVQVQPTRAAKDTAVQPGAGSVGVGVGAAERGRDRALEPVIITEPETVEEKARRENIFGQGVLSTWTTPTETKILGGLINDDVIYTMQNKQIDLKRVVDAIQSTVGNIAAKWDAYLQETLYHGRTAKRTQDYLNNELQKQVEVMQKYGLTKEEVGTYLWNRHAPEANRHIAERNPRFPDGGSGIMTADARKYMADLKPEKRKQLEEVAALIDDGYRKLHEELVAYGLETPETISNWREMFDYYIPLNRVDSDFDVNRAMTQGAGYSVSGATAKARTGSTKEVNVSEILANIAMQRERAIVRAEKNRVAQALFGLALQNPNTEFWLAIDPETNPVWKSLRMEKQLQDDLVLLNDILAQGDLDPELRKEYEAEVKRAQKRLDNERKKVPQALEKAMDQLADMGLDPTLVDQLMMPPMKARYDKAQNKVVYEPSVSPVSPHVLSTRVNGEDKFVLFNANNDRAKRMVESLKNMDSDQLGRALNISAKITRFFAAINTQYNPVFGAYNFLRDVQTGLLQINDTPIADQKKKVIAGTMPAIRAIYQSSRKLRKGEMVDKEWNNLWEEFQQEGGQTGFRDVFSQSDERAEAIQRMIDPSTWVDSPLGKVFTANGALKMPMEQARKVGAPLFNWLADYNQTMENAVRLSAYKAAKDKFTAQGMPLEDAKQRAAAIAKDLTVNFNRKGQIANQAGALYAFFNASVQGTTRMFQLLRSPVGKKIAGGAFLLGTMQAFMFAAAGFEEGEPPEFVKQRNYIIPTGDGKYIAFPMPLGFNVLPNTSRVITEWALSGFKDTPERALDIIDSMMDMFNPIGNAGLSYQSISPTMFDPLVALSENKDWTGKPIRREDMSALDPSPGYTRTRDSASWIGEQLAYYLNLASGGTDATKGIVSPTGDDIDYLVGQLTGGVGREALKLTKTGQAIAEGEELPSYNVPLFGRFYGDVRGMAATSNAFYRNVTTMNEHKREIDDLREKRGNLSEYLSKNPDARLYKMAGKQYREIQKLREARRMALERGNKQQAKTIENTIKARMEQFNKRVEELKK